VALRDKLRQRVQPLLEPGEEIQEIFLARSPPGRKAFVAGAAATLASSFWIVAATDRSIVVCSVKSRMNLGIPKEIVARFPRNTRLGPITRRDFAELNVSIEARPVLVRRPFFKDVERADAW